MVDREKVIEGLECCSRTTAEPNCEECPYYKDKTDCSGEMMRDALALLKEQEPRNALNIVKVHEGTLGNCPTCGAELMSYYNEIHCGRCGQAVKWNG